MARRGMCSRREADRFIEQGLVLVDGKPVSTLGLKVQEDQEISLSDAALRQQAELVTVLLNKPIGYISGLPEDGYESAVMLINPDNRHYPGDKTPSRHGLAPAGRLDIDSMGLIVFTNDGRIAKRLIGERSPVEKEYLIWVRGDITADKRALLRHGLVLDNKPLKPARVDHLKGSQLRLVLTEGRKRQIRRMCELVDLRVSRLIRVRIGDVRLGKLPAGKWRLFKPPEKF